MPEEVIVSHRRFPSNDTTIRSSSPRSACGSSTTTIESSDHLDEQRQVQQALGAQQSRVLDWQAAAENESALESFEAFYRSPRLQFESHDERKAEDAATEASSEVDWEFLLSSKETTHANQIADLQEDHAAELKEVQEKLDAALRRKTLVQQQVKDQSKVKEEAISRCDELKKRCEELQAETTSKDELVSNMMLAQQNIRAHLDELRGRPNGQCQDCDALKQQLDHTFNDKMVISAAAGEDKEQAQHWLSRMWQLSHGLEERPGNTAHIDKLLECKDKAMDNLEERAQNLEEQLVKEKKSSLVDRRVAKAEMNRQNEKIAEQDTVILSLRDRLQYQKTYHDSNLNLLQGEVQKDDLIKAMNDRYKALQKDQTEITAQAERLQADMKVEMSIVTKKNADLESRCGELSRRFEDKDLEATRLQETNADLAMDIENKQWNLETRAYQLEQQEQKINELNTEVSNLSQQLVGLNQLPLAEQAKWHIHRLQNENRLHVANYEEACKRLRNFEDAENTRKYFAPTDYCAKVMLEQHAESLEQRLLEGDSEIGRLREKLQQHEKSKDRKPLKDRTDKHLEEALKDTMAEVRELQDKLGEQVSQSQRDANLQMQLQTNALNKCNALRQVAKALWVRTSRFEKSLKELGRETIEADRDHDGFMQEAKSLLGVNDEEENGR